jgi:hypothetical protein
VPRGEGTVRTVSRATPADKGDIRNWWYKGHKVDITWLGLTQAVIRLKDNGQGMPGAWFIIGARGIERWLR